MPVPHLLSLSLNVPPAVSREAHPFNLPVLRALEKLEFTSPVTFLVGENGSGKSSLLEGLACAVGSIVAGSDSAEGDATLAAGRRLAPYLKLVWRKKTRKGFFLRAEDFFGYAKRLAQIRVGLEEDLREVDNEYKGRSQLAYDLARTPYLGQLAALNQRYGGDLDARSHGESFLTFFHARFVPGGLYLLDEPEAPLSPLRQVAFLALLKQLVTQDAQFIIATHSPILMAFPGATILSFEGGQIQTAEYETLEHVRLTRDFLQDPERFLRHL